MIPQWRSRRNLLLLWVGQFVSNLGDQVFAVLVTFLILTLEQGREPARKAGIAQFLNYLPHLLFGILAGTLVDRLDRRKTMIVSDLARMVLVLGIPLALAAGTLHWLTVAAVAFGLTTCATVFNPARDAYIPEIAGEKELLRANAIFQSSILLAMVLGSFLAGTLVAANVAKIAAGPAAPEVARIVGAIALAALTFLASAITLTLIRPVAGGQVAGGPAASGTPAGPAAPAAPPASPPLSMWRDLREGLRDVLAKPLVGKLLALTAIDNFFLMGPAILGANLLVKQTFQLGPDRFAYLQTSMGTGWLLGTLALARWGKRVPKGKMVLTGMIMDGLTYVPMFFIRHYSLLLAALLFHGLFIPWIVVGRTALIQENVPRLRLGRVFALVNLTVVGTSGLSMVATGEVAQAGLTPPQIFLVGGLTAGLCGVVGFFSRELRSIR